MAEGLRAISGCKIVLTPKQTGGKVYGMAKCGEDIFVATEAGVFVLSGGDAFKLEPVVDG